MGFSDSNDISMSSSICCVAGANETFSPEPSPLDVTAFKRLSETLESVFDASSSPDFDFFADAKLVAACGKEIPVHRCILSARSPFFRSVFSGKDKSVKLVLKELMKEYEVSYDAVVTVLAYLYCGKIRASPKDVCVCVDIECSHVACRPALEFMVELLYASFTFQISELITKFQRQLLDILNKAAADDVLMVLSVANTCGKGCEALLATCIDIIVKSDVDIITLEKALPFHIVKQITDSRMELGLQLPESNGGARPSDLTSDGRKALQIAKRLTRAVDYKSAEEGKAPKERLCIEILEQAERRDPLLGEASVSLAMAGDDLRMKLLYLENRVGLAKLLFPIEAKVAMDIAQVDGTSESPLASIINKNMADARRMTVDLNDVPFKLKDEHLNRMRALSKTVELGKRFFPRCSEVLNKIMDNEDLSEIACMGNETPEERQAKKQRYLELQEILTKAFTEDKEEFDKANISSSSSSTSLAAVNSNGKLPFKKPGL
nr:regulatory protein NPR1 [Ipomoea batatas]